VEKEDYEKKLFLPKKILRAWKKGYDFGSSRGKMSKKRRRA